VHGEEPGFLRSQLTEDTANTTFDVGRVVFFVAAMTGVFSLFMFCVIALLSVILRADHAFDMTAFGTGVAAIIAGIGGLATGTGALLLMKAKGEGAPQ